MRARRLSRKVRWLQAPIINRTIGRLYFRLFIGGKTCYAEVNGSDRLRRFWLGHLLDYTHATEVQWMHPTEQE